LVLELTETSIICEFERSRLVIEELRSLGLVVSIDDFGAGFTSLAYLSNLAVGELKLDRTFIASLATRQSGRDFELVRSTIDLGHALGLRVVAEGIEDGETLDLLSAIGCDLAQGYFISRPKAAKDLSFRSDQATTQAAAFSARQDPSAAGAVLDRLRERPALPFPAEPASPPDPVGHGAR
jgi:EAL domain-containing protein (putative c-di-GMP-specific phosphodiesterase class I)